MAEALNKSYSSYFFYVTLHKQNEKKPRFLKRSSLASLDVVLECPQRATTPRVINTFCDIYDAFLFVLWALQLRHKRINDKKTICTVTLTLFFYFLPAQNICPQLVGYLLLLSRARF